MNRYSPWRYVLLTILIILGVVYALPNLYGEDPAIQVSIKEMTAADTSLDNAALSNHITAALKTQGISHFSINQTGKTLLIQFQNTEDQLKAHDIVQETVGDNYSVAPTLTSRTPAWLTAIGARPMKLGLDLRGGIHFLLDVKTDDLLKAQKTDDTRAMALALRKASVSYQNIRSAPQVDQPIIILFQNTQARDQAAKTLKKQFPDYDISTTGMTVQASFSKQAIDNLQRTTIAQITDILSTRINELGVAEPVIQQQGSHYISVDLPGTQDAAAAKEIIGKVATVYWQLVDTEHDPQVAARTGVIPPGTQLLYTDTNEPVLLKGSAVLQGSSIIHASSMPDPQTGKPSVQVRVSGPEVSSFNRVTADNVGKPMAAIYVETKTVSHKENGKLVSQEQKIAQVINVAVIQSALGNNFEINNLPSSAYAKQLALLLRSGAYVVPVAYVQERLIGPSLGKENIRMGVWSTVIGSLLVIIFMIFYYRLFGLFADLALLLDIIFIVAVLSILGATLTLPGIAGIVLTVGMAVDANVLINERVREELRNGVSPQASIKAGYDRAFLTIVDAHVAILIVMIVLFALGSGTVQGFAVTTTIGLVASMVTAIFFTRALVNLTYGGRSISHLSIGIRRPIQTDKQKRVL